MQQAVFILVPLIRSAGRKPTSCYSVRLLVASRRARVNNCLPMTFRVGLIFPAESRVFHAGQDNERMGILLPSRKSARFFSAQ